MKLRLGLRYVRGLREEAGRALVHARERSPFTSIDDLVRRVPELRKNDLVMLAQIGALNNIEQFQLCHPSASRPKADRSRNDKIHRRSALWHVDAAANPSGPLFKSLETEDTASPLDRMTNDERLLADYHGTGMTIGPHPMAYRRAEMQARKVLSAAEIRSLPNGKYVRAAGCVICRQRPGTASGLIFLSLEDETGIANVIVRPELYEREKLIVLGSRFVVVAGRLQNVDSIVHVQAERIIPLSTYEKLEPEIQSHDFH